MEHEVKFISRKPETVLWLFVGSQTEDFSCHLPDGYFPHFYVTYGRIGIAECVVEIGRKRFAGQTDTYEYYSFCSAIGDYRGTIKGVYRNYKEDDCFV